MTKLVAALDGSPASQPVIATAGAVSRVLGTEVHAVHVQAGGGERTARALCDAAGIPLELIPGPAPDALAGVASEPDVAAMVVGARRTPLTPDPGRTALQLVDALGIPLFVVPPDTPRPGQLERVLVPLQGTTPTSFTPRRFIPLAPDAGLEFIALQVHDEDSIPAFSDQPQHETPAWAHEFLARYSPIGATEVDLRVRVGDRPDVTVAVAEEVDPDLVAFVWGPEVVPSCVGIGRALLRRSRLPLLFIPVLLGADNAPELAAAGDGAA